MKWYIQGLVFGYLSAPQRTGRLGRGLEMGDGHQEHSTRNWGCLAHSIELALGSIELCPSWLPFPSLKPAPARLSEKNHKNKEKYVQDRHGNSSQVSLF
ncbi:unnamed protein product [Microthlaspi erraticum]|uniref:Uncharacterized protein n=1 Tax=Microthlaspi erraticum TaxID=1685480 RepID=A0A6D2IV57_9BRAS|nr:unnamed protein product [Microthlaspi erraticum]